MLNKISHLHIPKITLFLFVLLFSTSRLSARNLSDTMELWRELSRLEAVFRDTTHLAFTGTYYLTDVDTTTSYDTAQIAYKVSKQRYKIVMDSTTIVQNDFYNLAVYSEQHIAVLNRAIHFGLNLLHINLADSIFSQLNIQSLQKTDSLVYRKLSFQFKTGSPYTQFDITYDTTSYHISRIEYDVKKDPYNSSSTHHYHVKLVCSGYQTGTFNDSVFSTTGYFIHKQGMYYLVAPYTSYRLVNSINE